MKPRRGEYSIGSLSAGFAGVVLFAGCAAQPAVPPEALEPLPTPPEAGAPLPPDVPEQQPIPLTEAEPDRAESLRPTGRAGPGMLPGVGQTATPGESHFERRLQERQKRINLGLDRPQREQEPVDNLIDLDF